MCPELAKALATDGFRCMWPTPLLLALGRLLSWLDRHLRAAAAGPQPVPSLRNASEQTTKY
jgi:hypothetical protein